MHPVSHLVCYLGIPALFVTTLPLWMSFSGGPPESERVLLLKKSFAVRVSRASITVLRALPPAKTCLRKYLKCGALSKILVSCYESSDDSMKDRLNPSQTLEQLLPYLKRKAIPGTNPDYIASVFTLLIRLVAASVNAVPSCK